MLGILIGFIMLFAPVVIGPINYMGFVFFLQWFENPSNINNISYYLYSSRLHSLACWSYGLKNLK